MGNPWVNHVKEYSKEKGMKYRDALKDAECKASYTKTGSGLEAVVESMSKPKYHKKVVVAEPTNKIQSVQY